MIKLSTEIHSDLTDLIDRAENSFVELVSIAETDVVIDEFNIDGEAIRTPKLHQKYSVMLAKESMALVKYQQIQKRIYLERWKYYNGKQTDTYYTKYGVFNEKILKGDIDKYLSADKRFGYSNELLEVQKQIVNYLERIIKDISHRGFHIKSVIDYRRFEAGI